MSLAARPLLAQVASRRNSPVAVATSRRPSPLRLIMAAAVSSAVSASSSSHPPDAAKEPAPSLRFQPKGTINLAVGHPAPGALPAEVMADAMEAAAARARAGHLKELNYVSRQGSDEFLGALAAYLSQEYGDDVRANTLLVTNGVSHGIDLACAMLTEPGDDVVVELPTYFLAAQIFVDHGLGVEGIQGGDEGFDVDALRARLEAGFRPKLVYLVPSHANPRGRAPQPTTDWSTQVSVPVPAMYTTPLCCTSALYTFSHTASTNRKSRLWSSTSRHADARVAPPPVGRARARVPLLHLG